jgi:hypothetical protein
VECLHCVASPEVYVVQGPQPTGASRRLGLLYSGVIRALAKIIVGTFRLVEPRGFEPLTSWLQISARSVYGGRWNRSATCSSPARSLAVDDVAVYECCTASEPGDRSWSRVRDLFDKPDLFDSCWVNHHGPALACAAQVCQYTRRLLIVFA